MAFQRVQFSKIFPGEHSPGPPYIIRVIGADSPLVSPVTWCLIFSDEKKNKKNPPYLDQINDDTESGCSRSLNTEETIRKETKLPLKKSLSQYR